VALKGPLLHQEFLPSKVTSKDQASPRHPALRRVSLLFLCRGDAIRRPVRGCSAIQVLHSRLRRSFRMTVCCAAKFHPRQAKKPGSSGAPVLRGAFLACGGSAREQTLPLMTLIYTDLNGLGCKAYSRITAEGARLCYTSFCAVNIGRGAKGVACKEGQKRHGFWVRFCQDGRIPSDASAKFAIDSLLRNLLQWAISSQSRKERF
jgi:hypothetical protein